jgi:hypothetical protein
MGQPTRAPLLTITHHPSPTTPHPLLLLIADPSDAGRFPLTLSPKLGFSRHRPAPLHTNLPAR